MAFFDKYPEVNAALENIEQKLAEHLQLYEKSYEFTTKLALHYSRALQEFFEEYRDLDKIPGYEGVLVKKIFSTHSMLKYYPDSYGHSVIYVEQSMQDLHEMTLSNSENSNLKDKIKIKGLLEKMYRAAGYITDTEDVQHSYCVQMDKVLHFANNTKLLTWDKDIEQRWIEGIKKNMPATYEKVIELSKSVWELQKAVGDAKIIEKIDEEVGQEAEKESKKRKYVSKVKPGLLEKDDLEKVEKIADILSEIARPANQHRLMFSDIMNKYKAENISNPERELCFKKYTDHIFGEVYGVREAAEYLLKKKDSISANKIKELYKTITQSGPTLDKFIATISDSIAELSKGCLLSGKDGEWEKETIEKLKSGLQKEIKDVYEVMGLSEELERSMVTKAYTSGKKERASFVRKGEPSFRIPESEFGR